MLTIEPSRKIRAANVREVGPEEHRLMKRCQVMATKIFDPDFLRESLALAA